MISDIIKVGLNFTLHERNYILTGFSGGSPLITCQETGQEQKVSDKILAKLLKVEEGL